MSTLYHSSVSDTSRPVDSLWEQGRTKLTAPPVSTLSADETADVAIIGGGYCGLTAAWYLAQRGYEVRLLEAGDIGWGASGRNGGFCSIGASFLTARELHHAYGEQETLSFYGVLIDAVRCVEEIAQREGIDLEAQAPGIWTFAHRASRIKDLEAQALVAQRLGVASRIVDGEELARSGFRCSEQAGALFEPLGFGLNPLAFCLGLASAAARHGAHLYARTRVTSWIRRNGSHRLTTQDGGVTARRVIVATNGWLPEDLVPELAGRVLPIMSSITATHRLEDEWLHAQGYLTPLPAANTRAHVSYIRLLPGQRLLFGGRGDTTGHPSALRDMQRLLEQRRRELFPALAEARTSHCWRGLIAATRRQTPAIGLLPDDRGIGYAFGCHGNGVAFMTWAGQTLGKLISGERVTLPATLVGLPPRFPLPSLRLWYLRLMLLRAHMEDTLD